MTIAKVQRRLLPAVYLLLTFCIVEFQRDSLSLEFESDVSYEQVIALDFTPANFVLPYGDDNGDLQYGMLWMPDSEQGDRTSDIPLIVFIHGGCWMNQYDIQHSYGATSALAQAGYAVWSLEYRRTGDPGGGWPGAFEDIKQGLTFVKALNEYSIDTNRMIIVGHSAGGHLALLAGVEFPDAIAVIGLAAISDIVSYAQGSSSCEAAATAFMGGAESDNPRLYQQANPAAQILHSNTFLLHGTNDAIVPLSQSRMPNASTQLITDAGHFDWVHPGTSAFNHLVSLIDEIVQQ